MITGIAAPANNRLQRTVMDEVSRHEAQRAAAEAGRHAPRPDGVARLCVTH
jgi:hypothetical protein